MGTCLKYDVTPTVCCRRVIAEMASALEEEELCNHTVDDKYVFNACKNVFYLHNNQTTLLAQVCIEHFRTTNVVII